MVDSGRTPLDCFAAAKQSLCASGRGDSPASMYVGRGDQGRHIRAAEHDTGGWRWGSSVTETSAVAEQRCSHRLWSRPRSWSTHPRVRRARKPGRSCSSTAAPGSGAQYETQSRRFDSNGYPEGYVRAFEYDSSFATNTFAQVVERLDALRRRPPGGARGRPGEPCRSLARDLRVQHLPEQSRRGPPRSPGTSASTGRATRRAASPAISSTAWASGKARTRPATSAGTTCD